MTKSKVNEDLQNERAKCDFNVEELTNYLDGGVKETEDRRKNGESIIYVSRRYAFEHEGINEI